MQALQQLQPVDLLLVVIWAAVVWWGFRAGVVRQVLMLLAVYAAAIVASQGYQPVGGLLMGVWQILTTVVSAFLPATGAGMASAFAGEAEAFMRFFAYVLLFLVVLGLGAYLAFRQYRYTRLGRAPRVDAALGALVGLAWGCLLVIAVVTMLRYYAIVSGPSQQPLAAQLGRSQVGVMLQALGAPLWQAMAPWFPERVPARLSRSG